MIVKDYMNENENKSVVIQRPYTESAEWTHTLYSGMLHDVPSELRKEEILSSEYNLNTDKTVVLVSKSRKFYQVVIKFNADLEEAILARAAEYGVGTGKYIKMLVEKDLEEAKKYRKT